MYEGILIEKGRCENGNIGSNRSVLGENQHPAVFWNPSETFRRDQTNDPRSETAANRIAKTLNMALKIDANFVQRSHEDG